MNRLRIEAGRLLSVLNTTSMTAATTKGVSSFMSFWERAAMYELTSGAPPKKSLTPFWSATWLEAEARIESATSLMLEPGVSLQMSRAALPSPETMEPTMCSRLITRSLISARSSAVMSAEISPTRSCT